MNKRGQTCVVVAVVSVSAAAGVSSAAPVFIGRSAIAGGPAAASDFSGLLHTLLEDNTTYQDGFDGFGSGMAYTGFGNRFVLLNDRGPNKVVYNAAVDNTTSYLNRFQVADITLAGSGNSYSVNVTPVATSMLKMSGGQNYIGISTAFTGANAALNRRLDPEGIAVHPDGSIYVSDEYGPTITHFSQTGEFLGSVAVPAKFGVTNLSATVAAEISGNTSGRVGNKGMEGLAVTPNGRTMVGAMQSPLLQDATVTGVNSNGTNVRFLKYDLTNPSAAPKEIVYQLDNAANLISEVTPINNHQFIVDERDAVGGTTGGVKKLYLIDIDQAGTTDVSGIASLSATGNTPGVAALSKTLFLDAGATLRASAGALIGNSLPDKFEGYSFGPDLADGRHTLLATNDNDYSTTYANYVFAFAIDDAYLASIGVTEFQHATLNPGVSFIPEPGGAAMVGVAGVLVLGRRRR